MRIAIEKICVATDFSEQAEHALRYGLALAEQFDARIHLVHVIQDILPMIPEPGMMAVMPTDAMMRNLEQGAEEGLENSLPEEIAAKLDVVHTVRHGVPFDEICQYAKEQDVDLLVLGTHGRTGLPHFLIGSVAERVVRCAPCPVLTVRHPDHEVRD